MDPDLPRPSLRDLFLTFLSIAMQGFGGVLPWARRVLVERRGWLTADDFNETLSLCQSLPGPNVVNLSVVVGSRFHGAAGAATCLAGLIGLPVALVIVLGALWGRFGALPGLEGGIIGVGAAAAGLVVATAAKMAEPLLRRSPLSAAPFIALAFVGVGLMRFALPWVLLALAPASIAVVSLLARGRRE